MIMLDWQSDFIHMSWIDNMKLQYHTNMVMIFKKII